MDAGKLFSELVNRQPDQTGGILTGTAVSDSVDGTVMVQMDGSVVAQPGEDEVTLTVSADDFVDGSYVLPSVPYAGSLTITDSDSNELEEQDYELDGARLTIFALSSSPIDIAYQTQVQQQITNDDFDGDRYSLDSVTNLTVEEMDSEGAWNPATYTLDGNIMTIEGIEHQAGIVEFAYTYDVSVVCEPGENVLPDAPDDVSVLGRNSSGVDVVVTDYVLDGNVITLPSTYDAYTVDYPVTTTETWNVSDQYQDEPLEDSDDAADPAIVTIGHNLQWPPSSVVSCTIDGTAATYALDDVNVVVDAPAVAERWFRLTYDAPVSLQVPASVFATGAFTLPSIPLGSVSTIRSGIVLENVVDDDQLAIASLVVDSPTYSIAYTEQVEQDVVELPCTPYVAEGQFVEVAVVNGMPTVIGASGSGDVTMTLAGDAADAAAAAEEAAAAAQEVAEAMNQHFWTDSNGVHVTEITQEEWAETPSGANQLSNSEGILLRDGLNPIVSIATGASSGMSVFDGSGSASTNVLATFTDDGVTLGREGEIQAFFTPTRFYLTNGGLRPVSFGLLNDQTTGLALLSESLTASNITPSGGEPYRGVSLTYNAADVVSVTVDGVATSDWSIVNQSNIALPSAAYGAAVEVEYHTSSLCAYAQFGELSRAKYANAFSAGGNADAIGAFTANRGRATGTYAFAAGNRSTASGFASVAMGNQSTAGNNSVAIGQDVTASSASTALGVSTNSSGYAAHAQNLGTVAASSYQTALGKYNIEDTRFTYALILGNGTSDSARSNALTVDWSGNVTTAGSVSAVDVTASGDVSADTITTTGNATIGGSVSAAGATLSDSATVTRDTSGNTGFIATRSDTGASVGTIVGAGGTNHGLYSFSDNRWIIYSNGTDIRTGAPLAKASGGTGTTYGLQWQSLGSFTGTNSLTINLSNYSEVMVAAKFNHTNSGTTTHKLATATIAKQLLSTTAQELWLGGGKSSGGTANSGALRAICNITTTKVTGVISSADSTDHTSGTTWYVYAR